MQNGSETVFFQNYQNEDKFNVLVEEFWKILNYPLLFMDIMVSFPD